jgi:Tol biopolymer transport system component
MRAITQQTNIENRKRTNIKLQSVWALVFALMLAVVASAHAQQSAGVLLQSGLYKEDVNGDLEAAIEIYERVLKEFPKDRPVAAKALLHIGLCYEKLGKEKAQKAYQRLVKEYADQPDAVAEARVRLAAMERDNGKSGVTVRQVWGPSRRPTSDTSGAPSPDGRYLSFTNWNYGNLAVRDLATGECRDITDEGTWDGDNQEAGDSIWSPDGKKIAYAWRNEGHWELRIVGLDGSKPRILYRYKERTGHIKPCTWSQDGKNILTMFHKRLGPDQPKREIALVSVADGSVRVLKSFERFGLGGCMSLSPDGRCVAYANLVGERGNWDIFLLSTDGSGKEVVLVEHPATDGHPVWTPDGKAVVFCSDRSGSFDLWLVQVTDGKSVGEPQLVKKGTGLISPMGFTRKGALYYGFRGGSRDVYVVSVDQTTGKLLSGPAKAIKSFEGFNGPAAWSPDGKSLAYVSRRPRPASAIPRHTLVIRDMESGQERELYPKVGLQGLHWSPDGRSILLGWNGQRRIDVQTGDVTRLVQLDPADNAKIHATDWSPDGNAVFYALRKAGNSVIMRYDLETGKEKEVADPDGWEAWNGLAVSPDGRRIALVGGKTIMVMPATGGELRILHRQDDREIEEEVGMWGSTWTADGRYLLFKKRREPMTELWRISAEGGEPQKLLAMKSLGAVSVHPDGRRIAFSCDVWSWQVWAIDNFLPESTTSK